MLIVTGAHLAAEVHDRPLAYHLRERLLAALGPAYGRSNNDSFSASSGGPHDPPNPHEPHDPHSTDNPLEGVVVCSDLWYLNRDHLRELPTISIGGPTVNALTAYLGDKVPSAFAVDGVFLVQADWLNQTPVACCWGADARATAQAVETFIERYLDEWAAAV